MKNIITSSLFLAAASALFAEDLIPYQNPITSDVTGVLYSDKPYVIGANGVTITHNRTAARHLSSNFSLDVKSYSGTNLVSDSIISGGGTTTNCFGFNGMTFTGDGREYEITVSATEDATNVGILEYGFKVDNVTVNMNLSGKSYFTHSNETVTVKNNGVLNYNGARPTASRTMSLTVEQGSEFNATFDGSASSGWRNTSIAGRFTATNAQLMQFYGENSISNQTAANPTLLGGRISLDGAGASLTISNSEANSILIQSSPSNLIMRQTTLTLNSSNALGVKLGDTLYNQDSISLEIGLNSGAPSASNLILGADNAFNQVMINSSASSSLNITLNGNKLNFKSLNTGLIGTIYITDFAENLLNISNVDSKFFDENFLLSCVKAGTADSATDLYWNSGTGFVSAMPIPVPEPAEWAALLGILALGFAAYRRRK